MDPGTAGLMGEKAYDVEQRLNSLLARGIAGPMSVVKPGDTPRSSVTAMNPDPDLTLPVEASSRYVFRCYLNYEGAAQGTADLQLTWTVPLLAALRYGATWVDTAGTTHVGQTFAGADVLTARTNGGGNLLAVMMLGSLIVGANAGPVTLKWGQNTSNGTGTIIHAGSVLELGKSA
jgi:hypothetical protein